MGEGCRGGRRHVGDELLDWRRNEEVSGMGGGGEGHQLRDMPI